MSNNRGAMPPYQRLTRHPLAEKVLLGLLAGVYVVYLAGFAHYLYTSANPSGVAIVVHATGANISAVSSYWTTATMDAATNADIQIENAGDFASQSSESNQAQGMLQKGQPSANNLPYPFSTIGRLFFTRNGLNNSCSGTAIVSQNSSVVDTAGHCLYLSGAWATDVIFCPLYKRGNTPYGCWMARDLEVPSDWISNSTAYYHDMGMAIVSPNSHGKLTDVVGGAGWAYNQSEEQAFSAYGYPAQDPYNGETRQSCTGSSTGRQFLGGRVISIPCDMTGGSSGGPWFIQINGEWYLNGHNDFTSSLQPDHMFSPVYDSTWYALYTRAQQT